MRTDGLTKAFDSKAKWDYAVYMPGLKFSPDDPDMEPPPRENKKIAVVAASPLAVGEPARDRVSGLS